MVQIELMSMGSNKEVLEKAKESLEKRADDEGRGGSIDINIRDENTLRLTTERHYADGSPSEKIIDKKHEVLVKKYLKLSKLIMGEAFDQAYRNNESTELLDFIFDCYDIAEDEMFEAGIFDNKWDGRTEWKLVE
jgi:hypothetical protein